jgi:hypothetical protein
MEAMRRAIKQLSGDNPLVMRWLFVLSYALRLVIRIGYSAMRKDMRWSVAAALVLYIGLVNVVNGIYFVY